MTIEVSNNEVYGTVCRYLWMAINRGVVPGVGIEPYPKLLINNCSSLLLGPSPRPSEKPLTR